MGSYVVVSTTSNTVAVVNQDRTVTVRDSVVIGPRGSDANVQVGNTFLGEEGSNVIITNVGNSTNVVLDFTIPRGNTGNAGPQGPAGNTGPVGPAGLSATVTVGNVVTTSEGSNVVITNVGDSSNVILDFSIPRGNTGNVGQKGLYWEGPWTNQLNYSATQAVYYEGNSYICLEFNSNTVPVGNSSFWGLLALKGQDGVAGANGADGANGTSATIVVGNVVTGAEGSNVIITNVGDASNVVLDFSIPRGNTGNTGSVTLPIANGTSNIDIPIANGYISVTANAFTWIFNETNGLLELAGNLANFSACSAINFVANSSGDGNGYSTIELRPDSNATNDQYLIIDPTAPSHIHIRAGGAQDNSNAELYLGGENSYFKVNNGENPSTEIASNNYVWTFNTDGTVTFPDSTLQTTAYTGTDIITTKKVFETTNALSSATGVVTHDCDNGHIFVHSSISANFTANFTNTTIAPNTATSFTLVLNQGATPYVANAVQINGVAQTVNWQGSTSAPGGNANKKDVISFSVVNNNGTWITLGQLTSFG